MNDFHDKFYGYVDNPNEDAYDDKRSLDMLHCRNCDRPTERYGALCSISCAREYYGENFADEVTEVDSQESED